MSTESEIIAAVSALNAFEKVRYVLADADSDSDPTGLPFFVLGGATRDFNSIKSFCGTELVISSYIATIGAKTASDARNYVDSVGAALTGIVNIADTSDDYDDDGGFYIVFLTLTTL